MRSGIQYLTTVTWKVGVILALLACNRTFAAEKTYPGPYVENDQLLIILISRTPEQMAAFYEARGFPRNAIDRIRKACFVTVHIENKSLTTLWLEQSNMDITSNNKPVPHMGIDYWNGQWDAIDLPLANRSTFGWTQLPLVRDLQPDESVGGNITIPGTIETFDMEVHFYIGQDKRGGMLVTRFKNVQCPKDESAP